MYFDALTMACLRDELAARLIDGRVQRVVQPDPLSLGLEVYAGQRYELLLSADAQRAGVLLAEAKLRRGTEAPSPMLLLLRKYVRGARLANITQDPLERVLRLTFVGPEGAVGLICEVMGRLSNLILVDEAGVVMDAIKRVPSTINRVRVTLPHQPYQAPPAQDKLQPYEVTPADLARLLEQGSGPAWRRLLDGVSGVSPLLAKEIVYRGTGELAPELPLSGSRIEALMLALDELLHLPQTRAWSPCVAYEQGQPRAWAAYDLTQCGERAPVEILSQGIWQVWGARATYDPYGQVRERLHGLIAEQVAREQGRLVSLGRSDYSAEDITLAQIKGNAILAMGWSLEPGQRELVVDPVALGLAEEGQAPETLRIALDPALSPSENAQAIFEHYRKQRAATDQVPALIEECKQELDYLAQLAAEVNLAEDRAQLDEVEEALREAGYLPQRNKRRAGAMASEPIHVRTATDALILVGRNSTQNHALTFKRAAPDDLWLHAHGVPGSHVIVKPGFGGQISEEDLQQAAQLAAYYSAARGERRVQVDYAPRRHVHPIRKGRPGMVTYTHEETVVVIPAAPEEP